MKKIYYIIFAIISFFTFTVVKADTLPSFNLGVNEYQYFDSQFFSNMTEQEFLDTILSLDSDYYNIVINQNTRYSDGSVARYGIYLIPKSTQEIDTSLTYATNTTGFNLNYQSVNSYITYYFDRNTSQAFNNSYYKYQWFKNCYQSNNCSSTDGTNVISTLVYRDNSPYNANGTYNDMPNYLYPYYSNVPFHLVAVSSVSFYEKFSSYSVNDKAIGVIPTYYDLYNAPSYIENSSNNIFDVLIGNISDLSNFHLNLTFNYDNYNYINNMNAYYYVYGRQNNSSYYSYQRLDSCVAINNNKLVKTINTSNNYAEFSYFGNGFNCGNLDLTQYDSFYIHLQTFSTSGTYSISNLNYNASSGNVKFFNNGDYNSINGYNIYETFENLPYNFSILLSTNDDVSYVRYYSDNNFVVGCPVLYTKNNKISQACSSSTFGKESQTGYMIYNMQNYNSSSTNLELLINEDTIVSFGTNGSDSNSSFTYYDSNGIIDTDTIENKLVMNYEEDKFVINQYIDDFNDYLDDFRNDIEDFAMLVQRFYDSMPVYFQEFLYICMLSLCIYIVFLIIRKW